MPEIRSQQSPLQTLIDTAPKIFEKSVILIDRLSQLVDDKNLPVNLKPTMYLKRRMYSRTECDRFVEEMQRKRG